MGDAIRSVRALEIIFGAIICNFRALKGIVESAESNSQTVVHDRSYGLSMIEVDKEDARLLSFLGRSGA